MTEQNPNLPDYCRVIDETNAQRFQDKVNYNHADGFEIVSSSNGYIPNPYDCNFFQCVMVRKSAK